jgi:hypothetical protein
LAPKPWSPSDDQREEKDGILSDDQREESKGQHSSSHSTNVAAAPCGTGGALGTAGFSPEFWI